MEKLKRKDLWNPKKSKEIVELYNSGLSCTKIGKMNNTSPCTISSILKANGVTVINKQNLILFTPEEIIDDYCVKKLSLTEISKKRKSSTSLISKILKEHNVEVCNFHNISKFDEHVFDSIDTEEKAYWLGFIFADGYISSHNSDKNKYRFEISLSEKDKDHLYKFNSFMKYNGDNVKFGKVNLNGKQYSKVRWSIGNKHLWETLNSLGCIPNKSLTLKFPNKEIFKEPWLIIPFIRGYFDGDGCITNVHPELNVGPCINASLLGTKDMLTPIKDLFFDNLLRNASNTNDITKIYNLTAKQTITFLEIIYYKATIYLDRKYNKFINWKNCRPKVKALGLLESKFGEYWNVNPELIYGFKRS